MPTSFKGVRGGTPTGEPLCRTCRHANYRQGQSLSSTTLKCGYVEEYLREEMCECRSYDDMRIPPLYELELTAWKAWRGLKGEIVFLNPAEFTLRERKRLQKEAEDE